MLNTAHEIRNFLTVIDGYCGLGLQGTKPAAFCFEKVIEASGKIEALLRKQLRSASATHGRIDLNATVRTVADAFEALPGAYVETTVTLQEDLPLGPAGDASEVFQALLNLCLNARKAMPDGGRLKLLTRRVGERIQVVVTDSGCGMPAETASKLWKRKGPGDGEHGRGLLIAKKAIEALAGEIAFVTQEGKGTSFQISLPVGKAGDGPFVA
jgi:signal transduction histidine kinase